MKVKVDTPLAVTSFFQYVEVDGRPGARGGGFIPYTRMETVVSLGRGNIIINEKKERGTTTERALELFQKGTSSKVDVLHRSPVPIGAGFGTSGSGSWAAVIGASFLLGGTKDYFELALYAHEAEIEMKTGLGTVASISAMPTGAGLLLEPGPPGRAVLKPIIFEEELYRLIFLVFGRKKTSLLLSSEERLGRISDAGERAIDIALKEASIEGLLSASRTFAERCGIVDKKFLRLCRKMEDMGALGAAPNMIGDAIHIVVKKERAEKLLRSLRKDYNAFTMIDKFGTGGAMVKHL